MAVGGRGRLAESLPGLLETLDVAWAEPGTNPGGATYKALVFDATGLTSSERAARAAGLLHAR